MKCLESAVDYDKRTGPNCRICENVFTGAVFFAHAECPEDIGAHPVDSGGKGNGRKLTFGKENERENYTTACDL